MTWKYFWWCDKKIIKCHTSIFLWNHVNIVFLQFISYMYYLWNKKNETRKKRWHFQKFSYSYSSTYEKSFSYQISYYLTLLKIWKWFLSLGYSWSKKEKKKKRNLLCIRPNYPTHVELNLINVCKRLQCIWHILL